MVTQFLVVALFLVAAPAPKDSVDAKGIGGGTSAAKRTQFLVESLQKRIPLDKPLEAPLKEIIAYLEMASSPPENQRDPPLRVKIVANDVAFKTVRGDTFDICEETLKLPRLRSGTLESALQLICEQVFATIVIRQDFIEITPFDRFVGREPKPGESLFFVNHYALKQPLEEILDRLAERYGRTVLIDPKTAGKARELVSAKLLNVPFDTAVELLAEMVELKVLHRDRAVFVTTPERAKALRAETPARPAEESPKEPKAFWPFK